MVHCNKNAAHAHRSGSGEPLSSIAMAHDSMLTDLVDSLISWVRGASRKGLQVWWYFENGSASFLWQMPPMLKLASLFGLEVQTVHYCAYQVFQLPVDLTYTSRKSTGILTNSPFAPKRCPGIGSIDHWGVQHSHPHTIAGGEGTVPPQFLKIPTATCVFITPAELVFDIARATLSNNAGDGSEPPVAEVSLPCAHPAMLVGVVAQQDFRLPAWIIEDVLGGAPGENQ